MWIVHNIKSDFFQTSSERMADELSRNRLSYPFEIKGDLLIWETGSGDIVAGETGNYYIFDKNTGRQEKYNLSPGPDWKQKDVYKRSVF